MNCKKIQNRLSQYLDGELTPVEKSSIETHLKTCQICRKLVKDFSDVWNLLNILPNPELQPYFHTRLQAKMYLKKTRHQKIWIKKILLSTSMVAIVCFGIFIGNITGINGSPSSFLKESEIYQSLYLESFNDIPASSLGEAYFELTTQSEFQEGGQS